MTAVAFCTSTLPPTQPQIGRDSNCGRHFPLSSSPATCCATAMLSSTMTSGNSCETWYLRSSVCSALALAASLCRTGSARQLEERVLEVTTRVFGEEHPDTLTSMWTLGLSFLEWRG